MNSLNKQKTKTEWIQWPLLHIHNSHPKYKGKRKIEQSREQQYLKLQFFSS